MSAHRLGLDLGSTAAKAALLDATGAVLATRIDATGKSPADAARALADGLLAEAGLSDGCGGGGAEAVKVVATGYGRAFAGGSSGSGFAGSPVRAVTEITCHARGVRHLHPDARAILDIGGQDAKAIRLDTDGSVADFAMNDRCAAGTGRFLEVVAARYGISVAELAGFCGGIPGAESEEEAFEISSTCVVFAESELVSLNARGVSPVAALRAVHRAIARRTLLLLKQAGIGTESPLYFTGGVAQNDVLRKAVAEVWGGEVVRAAHCQFTGAIGAALLA